MITLIWAYLTNILHNFIRGHFYIPVHGFTEFRVLCTHDPI